MYIIHNIGQNEVKIHLVSHHDLSLPPACNTSTNNLIQPWSITEQWGERNEHALDAKNQILVKI